MQIRVINEINCFRCSWQMEYMLPEVFDDVNTTLKCPGCGIKYFVPNNLLKEGEVVLKAKFYLDNGDTGSGQPTIRKDSAMPQVTPTHSDA